MTVFLYAHMNGLTFATFRTDIGIVDIINQTTVSPILLPMLSTRSIGADSHCWITLIYTAVDYFNYQLADIFYRNKLRK